MGLFDRKKTNDVEEDENKEESEEIYEHEVDCNNCGDSNILLEIPFGMTVMDYANKENPQCERCGCSIFNDSEEESPKKKDD